MNRQEKIRLASFSVMCVLLMLFANPAWAITLSLNPSYSEVGVGDLFEVDIVIYGLENTDLSTFELTLNYDDAILDFDSYELGDGLGDIGLGEALDLSAGEIGIGMVNLAELSLLWDLSSQPDAFTLATVSFIAESIGISKLSLSDGVLGDTWGDPLYARAGTRTVNVTPEPVSLLLLGMGLIGLARFGRKFKKL